MQEFKVKRKFITTVKLTLFGFLVFVAFGLSLPFIPTQETSGAAVTIILSTVVSVFFGLLAFFTWLTLKKLPYSTVVIDNDGIWFKHIGKVSGLVAWGQVSEVKGRPILQRLDLLASNKKPLFSVEYQLDGFENLRNILNQKISTSNYKILQNKFSKSIFYKLFYLVLVICSIGAGFYLGSVYNPLFSYAGAGAFTAMLIYEYAIEITAIEIMDNAFKVSYLFREKIISYSDILDIQILDTFHKGNRRPEVLIMVKKIKKPYTLRQLGIDENTLLSILRGAVRL